MSFKTVGLVLLGGALAIAVDRYAQLSLPGDAETTQLQSESASPMPPDFSRSGEARALLPTQSLEASRHSAIVSATRLAAPAVVSITVIRAQMVVLRNPFFDDPFFDLFNPQYRRKEFSSLGSGVIVDQKGHVITNSHVMGQGGDIQKILVMLPDGREFEGRFIGADPDNDLAVLRVMGDSLPVATLQKDPDNLIGEWVVAIGNPYGYLMGDPQPSITVGVISAVGRSFSPTSGIRYHDMIQTDASINPGNSGGALVNTTGEVIGINSFIITGDGSRQGSIGMGFAIPIRKAMRVVDELLQYGYIRQFTTGIFTDQAYNGGFGEGGVVVSGLVPGSPGEKAGLKVGDIIDQVAGKRVANLDAVLEILRLFRVGESVDIGYRRGGQRLKTTMILEEKKEAGRKSR